MHRHEDAGSRIWGGANGDAAPPQPASIQALLEVLLKAQHDLPRLLDGFKWSYDKGDLNHWVPLLNLFDDVLEEAIKDRPDLTLADVPGPEHSAGPFPAATVLAVLRTTTVILDNCSNKHLYQSHDSGLSPSSDALCSLPGMLVALCLNTAGLAAVREQRVLEALLPIFTGRRYTKALAGDAAVMIGAGLEELFRLLASEAFEPHLPQRQRAFTPSLRSEGVDVVVNLVRAICVLGGDEAQTQVARQQTAAAQEAAAKAAAATAAAAAEAAAAAAAAGAPGAAAAEGASGAAEAAGGAAEPMETDGSPADAADAAAATDAQGAVAAVPTAAADAAPPASEPADTVVPDADATPGAEADAGGAAQAMELDAAEGAAAAAADAPAAAAAPAATAAAGSGEPVPYDFSAILAEAEGVKDGDTFLTEALSNVTRMLEGLVTHPETGRLLVERGLVPLLLQLYHLPRLSFTFAFSSSSHPLLSVARALAPNHASIVSDRTVEALAAVLPAALARVHALGTGACVPAMSAAERAQYLKSVASAAGLITVASVVARTSNAMLQQLSMVPERRVGAGGGAGAAAAAAGGGGGAEAGEAGAGGSGGAAAGEAEAEAVREPVLVTMGRFERALMAQADVADAWAMQRAEAEKASGADAAASASTGQADGPAAMATDAPAAPPSDTAAPTATVAAAAAADGEDLIVPDADGGVAAAAAAAGDLAAIAGAAAAAAAASGAAGATAVPPKSRRTPEELSHDVLHHSLLAIRTFYVAVAKAIHTTSRRNGREEAAALPSLGMRGAALCLAVNVKGMLDQELPYTPYTPAAAAPPGVAVAAVAAAGGSEGGGGGEAKAEAEGPDAMAVDVAPPALPPNRRAVHLSRLADVVFHLLLDSRRRSCHVLLLNYFVGIGGLDSFSRRFEQAAANMWSVLEAQAAAKAATATQQQQQAAVAAAVPQPDGGVESGAMAAEPAAAPAVADAAMAEGAAAEPDAAAAPAAAGAGGAARAPGGAAAVDAARAAGGGSSTSTVSAAVRKDPVAVAEKCLASYLAVPAAVLPAALTDALSAWRPCGLLGDDEQSRGMRLCTVLLQQLQAHGDKWCPPLRLSAAPTDELLPSPSSATQAVLQLLARLTRRHANAAAASCDT
ncbi:E3 ubiquitin-protein ligase [Tetrabaena socialis]|uniref:E3 ubiquitin-protein ligase n=1 Tax=Tetrabaena socialis TaxID=47790 RepID=A0A2J8AEJ5_9CHLO|nr:E3 ubiquitin-protein ligase [Tetrabaena socialis]|eukprot:PNH10945.1 E3 ubiquitin-protein ligase [Tetrabaena socialis]